LEQRFSEALERFIHPLLTSTFHPAFTSTFHKRVATTLLCFSASHVIFVVNDKYVATQASDFVLQMLVDQAEDKVSCGKPLLYYMSEWIVTIS